MEESKTCHFRKGYTQSMNSMFIVVDGNWGEWEPWKPCTVSCNGGIRLRDRQCDAPAPRHGGKDCEGTAQEKEPCNEQQCAGMYPCNDF